MKAPGLLGGSVVTGLANVAANAMNAPTWALMTITVLGLLCVLLLGLVQLTMPQESQDKRLLWERFFEYKERRSIAAPARKSRLRRAVPTDPEHDGTLVAPPRSPTPSKRTTARSP
ncbi:hypothetical protein ACWDXH_11520 [Micromonospora chokoriensis]